MKILILAPYPLNQAPSQRFRFEQYLDTLKDNGFILSFQSFLDKKTWNILYNEGNGLSKTLGILKGFIRRFFLLFKLKSFDYVFIHREASPIGPPFFEWLITKIFRKKVIFDFDDAIWIQNTSKENERVSALKWHSKTASICKWSYKVSCGNQYLADYADVFNENVVVNPTTIDTNGFHVPNQKQHEQLIIGWTGTHSTIKYLEHIVPLLEELAKTHEFIFKVISNKAPSFKLPFMQFVEWSEGNEIEELNTFDIGLMPLADDDWAKGKCGFKALQYMALEIPALVSPVGVNKEIVEDGVNGFHCEKDNDWIINLEHLIKNNRKRHEMGKMGRKKVIEKYSVESNKKNFLSLFD